MYPVTHNLVSAKCKLNKNENNFGQTVIIITLQTLAFLSLSARTVDLTVTNNRANPYRWPVFRPVSFALKMTIPVF